MVTPKGALRDAGIMRDGSAFQAGDAGIALAFLGYLTEKMRHCREVDIPLTAACYHRRLGGLTDSTEGN